MRRRARRADAELSEIARAEVGQLVTFPVAPDVFHRIEFRHVGRQPLASSAGPADHGVYPRAAGARCCGSPSPDHQQVAQQMAEVVDHLGGMDGAGRARSGSSTRKPLDALVLLSQTIVEYPQPFGRFAK